MDGHAVGDEGAAGYVLPRDSQRLLAQVGSHLQFLVRLAQPRAADATPPWASVAGMGGWAACLEPLAGQVEQVLGALVWPAQCTPEHAAGAMPQAAVTGGAVPGTAAAAPAVPGRWVFGLTLDQLDTLHRLAQGISAFGDAVSAQGMAHAAAGTVPVLGQAVVERAGQLAALLGQVEVQRMQAQAPAGHAVGEARAMYGAPSQDLGGVGVGEVQAGMPIAAAGTRRATASGAAAHRRARTGWPGPGTAARAPSAPVPAVAGDARTGWPRQAAQGSAGGRP